MISRIWPTRGAGGSGLLLGCVVLGCSACDGTDERGDQLLARAFDQQLMWSDLRQVVPLEATTEDSAAMADQFIESWIKQQVLLHMAEQNQALDRMDIDAQLEDYRRSLVIFNYEQALVDQKLDTAVGAADIERYYSEHQANFELKETIIRARWFKVNELDKRALRRMEERFLRGTSEDLHELELTLAGKGVSIVDRSTTWTPIGVLLAELGIPETSGQGAIAPKGKQVIKGDQGLWFLEVLDSRAQNSVSPLEMVRSDIRAILLNQRKIQLIEDMRTALYAQAKENKDVERFDQ